MTRRKHLQSVDGVGGVGGADGADVEVRPYAFAARTYFREGWSPLPLPPREKTYPPTGYTGYKGRPAEYEKVEQWVKSKGDGNIALRMPPDILGIDVDAYGEKDGAATFARAEEEWGELPPTWRSTSRSDGVSGIRLYRVPAGLKWPGQLPQGGGVELCPWTHRYVIAAPSIHPDTGAQYHWFSPGGNCTTERMLVPQQDWEFPAPDDLPALPKRWVDGLTARKKYEGHEEADLDPEEVAQWIEDRPDGPMCEKMQRTLDLWMSKISAGGEDGGVHDSTRDGSWAVMRDAAAGHVGLKHALRKIMLGHKEGLRTRGEGRAGKTGAEWASIKARGVRKVAAEGPTDEDDPCALAAVSRTAARRNRGSSDMDFTRDDIGNGRRFAMDWRDEVRWVPAYGQWFIWNGRVWAPDIDGEILRMAAKTIAGMERELAFIEDTKEKAAFRKFIRASSSHGRINSMLLQGQSNKGMTAPAERFDSNINQLVCPNGTLVLPLEFSGEQIRRVPSLQEHLNTVLTGTDYIEGADRGPDGADWQKFLERFQPDPEIRDWLQKLAGYSLLGRNPRRLMVVAMGETSTGKSTFAEAVAGALGAYGASANMTIFRDNQDEKPRPDLIRVLPRRFVYAEEASRSWHLHPDQIKRLTGGTPITARTLQAKVFVDMVPRFTPWLVTNNAPTIEGADRALKRRIIVVPFDVEIPKSEEDAGFRERLASPGGRQAVLAWLVEGYRMYLRSPESLQEIPLGAVPANAKFWREISDLEACLDEIGEAGEQDDVAYRVKPMDLYKAYQIWCTENGVAGRDVWSNTKFGREVNDRFPKKRVKEDGKVVWYRVGFRLSEGWAKVAG